MTDVWRECRTAARSLARARGFTVTATLVVALGVGSTTAIFALVDASLVRPLPFADPDRLVMLWERPPSYARNRVSPLNFLDWSTENRSFVSMAAIAGFNRVLTRDGRVPERIPGQSVTPTFFELLGIRPIAGRTFVAADAHPNPDVVVISERFWRTRLDAAPDAVGRTIALDGVPTTVIGVVPAAFQMLFPAEIWSPFPIRRSPEQRRQHYLQVIGRLAPGRSIDDARADMRLVADAIAQAAPDTNKNWGVTIEPLRAGLVGAELRTTAFVFGAVVLFVLLTACGNVANLLLARGVARSRELAVRAALGASAAQIARVLLFESAVLAAVGGIAGVALAWLALRAAPAVLPPDLLPAGIALRFDLRVAIAAAACSAAAGVLFGVAPARHAARTSLVEALSAGGRTVAQAGGIRRALAILQVAGAVMLLATAALLVRTLLAMQSSDPGFHAESVVTMSLALPFSGYPDETAIRRFYREVERSLAALPRVRRVALGNNLPLDGWDIGQPVTIVGDPPVDPSSWPSAHYVMVSPGYFETLGIALRAGRAFDVHDDAQGAPVCIVNEAFVRRFLHGRDPLQAVVRVPNMAPGQAPAVPRRIVGVAAQVAIEAGETEKAAGIYVPLEQNAWYTSFIALRTDGDPLAVVDAVRSAIARIDPSQPVTRVRTLEDISAAAVMRPRFRAALVATFAAMATSLAGVGIFAVLMCSVRERTREFGVRRALGATPGRILADVTGTGARIAAAGAAIGVAAAAALGRVIVSLLYGVTPLDPVAFLAAAAALAVVAVAASVTPAAAALRVDPAEALRYP